MDEYQDTNPAQYNLIRLLAGDRRNLCVVGDDDQSIYSWRGADIRNILEFEKDFPGEGHPAGAELPLHRHHPGAAGEVVKNNYGRKGQDALDRTARREDPLTTGARVATARRPVSSAGDRQSLRAAGVAEEMAVFYRTNAQSRLVEESLVGDGAPLPHRRRRPLLCPHGGQGRSGLPARTGEPLRHGGLRAHRELPPARDRPDLAGAPRGPGEHPWRPDLGRGRRARARARTRRGGAEGRGPLHGGDGALARARRGRRGGRGPAARAAGGDRVRGGAPGRAHDRVPGPAREPGGAGGRRARFSTPPAPPGMAETDDEPGVEQFLQQVALFNEQDSLSDDDGIVTLMTLHNAKGLEYDTVFVIGMEDGVFPHLRAIEAGDVEEERRLAYVGMTRARRELYLTNARSRSLFGGREWNVRSRFIDEVPIELTDRDENELTGAAAASTWSGTAAAPTRAPLPAAGPRSRSARTWCTRTSARAW